MNIKHFQICKSYVCIAAEKTRCSYTLIKHFPKWFHWLCFVLFCHRNIKKGKEPWEECAEPLKQKCTAYIQVVPRNGIPSTELRGLWDHDFNDTEIFACHLTSWPWRILVVRFSLLAMLEKFMTGEENKFLGKGGTNSSLSEESTSPRNMSVEAQASLDYLGERTLTDMGSAPPALRCQVITASDESSCRLRWPFISSHVIPGRLDNVQAMLQSIHTGVVLGKWSSLASIFHRSHSLLLHPFS